MLSDIELLGKLRDGDKGAFDHFYKLYSLPIYRKLLKLVKVDLLAEELLQDVFVRLWEKRHLIAPEQSFKSYLYLIAQNIVYDFYRKAARDGKLLSEIKAVSVAAYLHTEETILFKETSEMLNNAIDGLPAQQKLVFILCKIEGKSYAEVSRRLGISISTINGHIVKATKHIKKYLHSSHKLTFGFVLAAIIISASDTI